MTSRPNPLSRWFRKLSGEAGPKPGESHHACTPIGQCRERTIVDVTGTLTRVDAHDEENRHWLAADIVDNSGTIQLIWMGRGRIPGIETGRRLRVSGRLANARGRQTLFNPRYELLP